MSTLNVNQSAAGREALRVIECLRQAGFEAVLAGGCVRDALLGRIPKDFDVATNAVPDQVRQVFGHRSTLAFGASFGVIGVQPPPVRTPRIKADDSKKQHRKTSDRKSDDTDSSAEASRSISGQSLQGHITEVATFRSDGLYSDGRRPDSVSYGDARADAMRRDFTINGLFYDPQHDRIIDHVGGLADLDRRRLRTIGLADDRFTEDKLRMLRAVRFTTTLQFALDDETLQAIRKHSANIDQVSGERIGAEMRRILSGDQGASGLNWLIETKLSSSLWPRLTPATVQRCQSLLSIFEEPSFVSFLAIILSDGDGLSELAWLRDRWKMSNDECDEIEFALDNYRALAEADRRPWSDLQPRITHRYSSLAIALADALKTNETSLAKIHSAMAMPIERRDPAPLIDGRALQKLGIQPGPHYRVLIQLVRNHQLDGILQTTQQAIEFVKSHPLTR
jgi:tRNA nucleotidyltransferase/poly(A) polymerase